jgi:hypothetical protein
VVLTTNPLLAPCQESVELYLWAFESVTGYLTFLLPSRRIFLETKVTGKCSLYPSLHTHHISQSANPCSQDIQKYDIKNISLDLREMGRVAQSVKRLATGWRVRGSNPSGVEIFQTSPDRPWSPPSLLYNGYRVFPWSRKRPGRDADSSPPSSAKV